MDHRTLEERIAASSIRSDDDGPTLSEEDVKKLADHPIQHMLPSLIRTEMGFLPTMNLTIFCTHGDLGFITSDRPCVWFDPEAFKKPFPFNQQHLASRTIEITLPLSPNHCALLSWFDCGDSYMDVDENNLDQLNRRTRSPVSNTSSRVAIKRTTFGSIPSRPRALDRAKTGALR